MSVKTKLPLVLGGLVDAVDRFAKLVTVVLQDTRPLSTTPRSITRARAHMLQ